MSHEGVPGSIQVLHRLECEDDQTPRPVGDSGLEVVHRLLPPCNDVRLAVDVGVYDDNGPVQLRTCPRRTHGHDIAGAWCNPIIE